MNINLIEKTALVCGASEGIGAATAKELAELGCNIILLARTESKLQKVLQTLKPGAHSYIVCDLSNHAEVEKLITAELAKRSTIEILINNAGGPPMGPISAATPEQINNTLQYHLYASMLLTKLLLPGMQKAHYGRIINILSTSVKAPLPYLGVSNTTRWAVAAWAKTLSIEVAPYGITVNNILPGLTATERLKELAIGLAAKQGTSLEAQIEKWKAEVPAKRIGTPEEIASAIAFLASPAASYINGVSLPVDGGRTPCY